MAKRKKNYLNNKDMLKEIHLSKTTYCSFLNKLEDNQQDFIVESLEEINSTQYVDVGKDAFGNVIWADVPVVELARKARATRLTKLGIPTDTGDIEIDDIVFRVMTEEHIPLVPKKKSKAAQIKAAKQAKSNAVFDDLLDEDDDEIADPSDANVEMVPMRCNFPPFFHYRIVPSEEFTKEDVWERLKNNYNFIFNLVGKSHWKGDVETGKFCMTHGKTTDNLAMMYMKLCERYGTRSNWRSYTYNDEMQGQALLQLSQIGLKFNELKSQNPFAYYTAAVTNSFTRVLNIEKKMQNIRDDILEANGLTPSWTRQFANVDVPNQFTYNYKSKKPFKDPNKKK